MASFLAASLRSKFISRLRPWLEDEPEIDLKIGFLKSHGIAKNLVFCPSALDSFLGDSARLVFRGVRVRELSVRVCPWSSPSIAVEVRGVDVTLALRETAEEKRLVRKDLAFRERRRRERKEVIASIDSEGASLHEILEKFILGTSSENGLMTMLSVVFLRSCQVLLEDIHLQLPLIDPHAGFLKVDKFTVEPHFSEKISLLRGFMHLLSSAKRENTMEINCHTLELGLKENAHPTCMASLVGLTTNIKLYKLQPAGYVVQAEHLDSKFSLIDIIIIRIVLNLITPDEIEDTRNGQDLWRIALHKASCLTLNRFSLQKAVETVILQLRYVHAYESLLLLVGYSAGKMFKSNLASVSSDRKKLNLVERQWRVVCELEERLPADAVGRARRIARKRTLLQPHAKDIESHAKAITTFSHRVLLLAVLCWKAIISVTQFVGRFVNVLSFSRRWCRTSRPSSLFHPDTSGDVDEGLHFSLNLGKLHITLCPAFSGQSILNDKAGTGYKPDDKIFPSVCVLVNLLCIVGAVGKSLLMAFEELKVIHSSSFVVSHTGSDLGHQRNQSPKKLLNDESTKKVIMWSDPAPMHHSEKSDIMNSSNYTSAGIYILKNNLTSLWSNWMKIHGEYEEIGVMHIRQPFFLCEIKSFLLDPSCSMGETELLKCSLVLGKLNLELDHGFVLDATQLFRQVQHFVHWTDVIGIQSPSPSSSFADKTTEIRLGDALEFYTNRMKVAIFSIIPDKNIQVVAHIAGPCIRMSFQRENFHITVDHVVNIDKGNGGYCVGVDVGDIDFVIWPTSKVILSKLMGKSGVAEAEADFIWLRELQLGETPKTHGDESFVSHGCITLDVRLKLYGLTAFVSDLRQDQQSLFVGPMSITFHSSMRRDYLCSLFATENVLSMVLSGLTTGAAALICTNDLWEFVKVVENLLSLASPLHIDSNDYGILYAEDFLGKLISYSKKVKRKEVIQSSGLDMIMKNTAQVQVDTTIEFESIDVIFIDSQKHVTGTQLESDAASSSGIVNHSMSLAFKEMPVPYMIDLPDYGLGVFIQKPCIKISWEEKFLRMMTDLSGVQSVIFRHQILKEFHTNVPQIKELIYQSCNHLYEFSLSYFIFSLHAGSQGSVIPSSDASSSVDGSALCSPRTLYTVEEPRLDEGSSHIFHRPNLKLETIELLTANNLMLYSGCGVLVDIRLGDMLMVEYHMKILQTKLDQAKKLKFSFHVSEEHSRVNCKIQGGYIFLETLALATFVECLEAYSLLIRTFSQWLFNVPQKSSGQAKKPVFRESLGDPTDHHDLVHATTPLYSTSQKGFLESKSNFLKDLAVDISQFSFILAVQDGSGGFQTSYVEVGASFNLMNFGRKVLFDLYRLMIFTKHLYSDMLHRARDECPALGGIHSKHATTSLGEILTENDVFESSHSGNHSYILKHLSAAALIEKLDSGDRQDFLPTKSYWAGKDAFGSGCIVVRGIQWNGE